MMWRRKRRSTRRNKTRFHSASVETLEARYMLTFVVGTSTYGDCCDHPSHSGNNRPSFMTAAGELSFSGYADFEEANDLVAPPIPANIDLGSIGLAERAKYRLTSNGNNTNYAYVDITSADGQSVLLSSVLPTGGAGSGHYDYTFEVDLVYDSGGGEQTVKSITQDGWYVGHDRTESEFSAGWWLNDLEFVIEQSGGASMIQANGSGVWFSESGGTYSTPNGVYGTLTKTTTPTSFYEWSDIYGNVAKFEQVGASANWLLASRTDANGEATTYTYDDADGDGLDDEIESITDPFGRSTTFAYYSSSPDTGRLENITDYAGRKTTFTYDNGRLSEIEEPQVLDETGAAVNPKTTFDYTAGGLVWKITDPNGGVDTYTYGSFGQLDTHTDADGYVYTYDPQVATGLGGIGEDYGSAPAAVLSSNARATEVNQRGYTTEKVTNVFSQLVSLTDPLGNQFDWFRDTETGRLDYYKEVIDVDGTLSNAHTDYSYVSSTDQYISQIELPSTDEVVFSGHNAIGLPTSITDEEDRVTKITYDQGGAGPNAVTVQHVRGTVDDSPLLPGDIEDIFYTYTYTDGTHATLPAGLLESATDPLLRETTYEYYDDDQDPLTYGRIKKITYADGTLDEAEVEYAYTITASSTVIMVTDELDRDTVYTYDALDRLTEVKRNPGDQNFEAVTEYKYDGKGNLRFIVDAELNETEYEYDGRDLLVKITEENPDDGGLLPAPVTEYHYDEVGNLRHIVDPLGRLTSYHYDAADRLIAVIEPDADDNIADPWTNPANVYDVNADGIVDLMDVAAIDDALTAHGNPHNVDSGVVPLYYYDVDADGNVDAADKSLVSSNLGQNPGPDYNDHDGRPVTLYSYDPSANLLSMTDANGNETDYTNDIRSRRTSAEGPLVDDGAGTPTRPETTYTYTKASELESITDPLGRVTEFEYDELGRLVYQFHADIDGTAQSEWHNRRNPYDVDQDGDVDVTDYNIVYNAELLEFSLENPPGANDNLVDVDGDGGLDNVDVDAIDEFVNNGIVTSAMYGIQPVTRYVYDKASNLTFVVDPMFSVTEYQYDDRDRLTYEILENISGPKSTPGSVSDPAQEVLVRPVTEYEYDGLGRRTAIINAIGNETGFAYDDLDRLETMTRPDPGAAGGNDQPEFDYTYDLVGNLLTETDAEGNNTTYDYDNLYRLIKITQPQVIDGSYDPNDANTETWDSPVTEYEYDEAGQLTKAIDPLIRETTYAYDGLGRLSRETLPGSPAPYTDFTYDLYGNRLTETNALGHEKEYVYDELHRRTKSIDETQKETLFSYDVVGNRLSLTDAESNETSWQYDGMNRVMQEDNALNETRSFVHDLVGNRVEKTDRMSRVTQFEFDHLHRNSFERWYNPDTTLDRTISFTYDFHGRLLSTDDPDHDYTYDYDELDRLTDVTLDIAGLTPDIEQTLTYDRMGNRLTSAVDFVDGTATADYLNTYQYDAIHRLTSIKQEDQAGNAVAGKLVRFTYDLAGQFDDITRYAGTLTTDAVVAVSAYTFDATGRLDTLDHYREDTSILINGYDFGYDQASRITSMAVESPLYSIESVDEYEYNDRNELTGASYADGGSNDETYTYDDNGNRIADASGTHDIGDNNQLTDDGDFTYTYDEEGNRDARHDKNSDAYTDYDWDHRNRLTKVTEYDTDGTTITKEVWFTYDSLNQQISRTVTESGTTMERFFTYDDGQIDLQFDGDGSSDLTHRYLWGPVVDQQLADEQLEDTSQTGRVVWPLTDHLGTVRDLVEYSDTSNTTATVVLKHRRYDAFGNIVSEVNRGDFNNDGVIDMADIDLLFEAIYEETFGEAYDLDGDGDVDDFDVEIWIEDIIETVMGDANLDGTVDGQDYLAWIQNRWGIEEYWSGADFNADGVTDSADWLIWNQNKFTGPGTVNNDVVSYIFGFTGRMLDDATGLQNNLNRWYDAVVGRWISEDPIGFAAGDANLYRYVANRVTSRTDPSGLIDPANDAQADRLLYGGEDPAGLGPINTKLDQQFRDDAKKHGLGDESDRILDIVKKESRLFDPLVDSVYDYYFGDHEEKKYGGLCGEWSEDVYRKLVEGLVDAKGWRIHIQDETRGPGPGYNDHAFIQVTFDDGTTYYLDNAYLGGFERVFTDERLRAWHDERQ